MYKKRIYNVFKKVSFLLVFLLVLSGFSTKGIVVRADSSDKAMNVGASVLQKGYNSPSAAMLYFGKTNDGDTPAPWRVISYDGKGVNNSTEGDITLFSYYNFGACKFNPWDSSYTNHYEGSFLIERMDQLEDKLTEAELAAGSRRDLLSGSYIDKYHRIDCLAGPQIDDVFFWPVSTHEGDSINSELRKIPSDLGEQKDWWGRSPARLKNSVCYGAKSGSMMYGDEGEYANAGARFGVRPAFRLKIDKVIITSDAVNGKVTDGIGSNSLKKVSDYSGKGWKVTVESGHETFKVKKSSTYCDGSAISIDYEGATSGDNEFVSAIITDSDNNIKYYGRLVEINSKEKEKGNVLIGLKGKIADNDEIYIFNENCNDDYRTDSSSALIQLTYNPEHDWEFKGFTWTGNDNDGYTEVVARYACKNDSSHKMDIKADLSSVVTNPTCNEGGNTVYIATVSAEKSLDKKEWNEKKTAKIRMALGHNWKFDKFIWTGDDDTGYSAAKAKYVCLNDENESLELDAEILSEVIEPTCTEDGKTIYTATIKSENSVDQLIHYEKKDAKKSLATNHDWKFTGFTWIGNDKDGYTSAEANYVCKNDDSHTIKVNAVIGEKVINPTYDKNGYTEYTANILLADSLDKSEHSEVKIAKETAKLEPPMDDDRHISGIPYTKMLSKGKDGLVIMWDKTIGADGYDIFFARCSRHDNKTKCKKVMTIEGNDTFSWTKTGLKSQTAYKAYIKAYIIKDGKKVYVKTGPVMHAFTNKGTKTYTNAKSMTVNKKKVSLKKGKTFKIKAKIKGEKKNKKIMSTGHAPKLRYLSTDESVATVSSKGKIKAKNTGTCNVYVYAHNGVFKKIKVTVK